MSDIKITKKELSQDFRDEFVKNLQGKDFILYGGLVTLAHANGFKGMKTELIQAPNKSNDGEAIVKAVVVDANGNEWHGIGDANDTNCNKKVAAHKIRMAETRAKGRALRDALGIDLTMDSELTDPYEKEMITQAQTKIIKKLMDEKGIDKLEVSKLAYQEFGVKTAARLEKEQAQVFISMLEMYDEDDEETEWEEEKKDQSAKGVKSKPSKVIIDDEDEDEEDDDE